VHLALKVADLEQATRFYEQVFGFRQTGTGYPRGHVSRHMTDGAFDLALLVYDSEDVPEAQISGAGPCIHHCGIQVEDRDAMAEKITAHGGEVISDPDEGALKFRAPHGTIAEIVRKGRYRKADINGARISGLSIAASDVAAAAEFYKRVFGFNETVAGADSRELGDGVFRLSILRDAAAQGRHHHWTITVSDPAACAKAIMQHGCARVGGDDLFRTPDGSLLRIASD
jgi:lactoylglutathione lyase